MKLANWAPALPGKLTKHYKGTHLDILRYTKFSPSWSIWVLGFGEPQGPGVWLVLLRTFPELVGRSVQNLEEIGLAVCAWKGDISRYIGTNSLFLYIDSSWVAKLPPLALAPRRPFCTLALIALARQDRLPEKNLMRLSDPSGNFMLHKVVVCLGFGVWGTLGSGGWVVRVMLALRTFPELVGRSVQNLVEIRQVVRL